MKHDSAVDFYILIRVQAGSAEDSRESGQTRQTVGPLWRLTTAVAATAACLFQTQAPFACSPGPYPSSVVRLKVTFSGAPVEVGSGCHGSRGAPIGGKIVGDSDYWHRGQRDTSATIAEQRAASVHGWSPAAWVHNALIARQEERHRLYDSEHSEHSGSSGVSKRHGDGYGDATTTSNDEPVGLATGEPREHGGGGHYAASCCDYDIFNPSYGERRSRDTAHVTSGICDAREAKKTRGDSTAFRRSIGSNDSSGGRYDVSAGSCNLAAADCRTTSGYAAS
ncbi:hypothetical protein PF004_g25390 [Phytophthora fragariae]|uniref:Uncharacterized protein n=1 Tax=Phytophthora fragariae TaxID=53985 RepID=A0A6G0MS94_9STRA|nr:hypothetical protein PF004_g25390 [Phytophthora fragariae]